MTDFRALCAELADSVELLLEMRSNDRPMRVTEDRLARARAALARPEPQGPTNEELEDFALQNGGGYFNCDCQEEADILTRKHISNYRAVLTRWGRAAIEPVPGVEDIHYAWELHDAEGEWQAGGSANSLDDVQREGNRYLQTYSQDGPHKLIIERHCVTTIEPVPGVEGADA